MNPSSKDWLYLFKEHVKKTDLQKIGLSNEEHKPCLFTAMLKTGLLFGYPSGLLFSSYPNSFLWNNADKTKIAYAECLYACFIKNSNGDFNDFIDSCSSFFRQTFYEELELIFNSKKDIYSQVESCIDKRIHNVTIFSTKHWLNSDFNTFSFIDILKYQVWLNENSAIPSFSLLIRTCVLLAGEKSKSSEKASTNIVEYFVGSTKDSIDIELKPYILQYPPSIQTYLKQIAYAFSALTYLADEILDDKEQLELFRIAFELDIEQLDAYMITLQTEEYVLSNYKQLPYFSNTKSIFKLKKAVQGKLLSLVKKNKASIIQEIRESKEALELIAKWNTQDLSDEEKKKVKSQLTDILKSLPSLAIFMLPGGSLALPILYKIIPEELLKPSAFRNQVDKKKE